MSSLVLDVLVALDLVFLAEVFVDFLVFFLLTYKKEINKSAYSYCSADVNLDGIFKAMNY